MARRPAEVLLATTLGGLAAGGALFAAGQAGAAHGAWAATTGVAIGAAAWWLVDAARHRRLGADVIALLALVGTLLVREFLAGAVIGVMLASGRALEARADAQARRELEALAGRAPRTAHRYAAGAVTDVDVDVVVAGDLLLVKPGEVIPVDGQVEAGAAVIDEAALTGESLPVERAAGDAVRSGTVNAGSPFDLRATTTAADSSYAGIVRLVGTAEAATAPSVRLADRYAAVFLGVALAAAGLAWGLSGEATRAVAVLVVATPCPLILAVPVALVGGLSRAARRGVIVKGGTALERLGSARVLLFDKTGTLTSGHPAVVGVITAPGRDADDVLRIAASLDQVSPHVVASAVVREARERGLALTVPTEVEERPGQGVRGRIDGTAAAVGRAAWVAPADVAQVWVRGVRRRAQRDGALTVFVGIDGVLAGALLLDDPIRVDAALTIRRLRHDGIRRVVMVSGDRAEVADAVGAVIGVDEVLGDRTPTEKVDAVIAERRGGVTVMVGDGINDAAALAAADVGVALGARGTTAASEAADVVLSVDRLDRLGEAVVIAQRARRIASQSAFAGIALSLFAMAWAGAGYLPAAWGALAQEGIDVAVIANALRALRPGRERTRFEQSEAVIAKRFADEHARLRPDIDAVQSAADALGVRAPQDAIAEVRAAYRRLADEIAPHELAEDAELYPVLNRVLGGDDPTGAMSRAHVEIAHQIRKLGRILDEIGTTPDDEDLVDLRRLLYGLYAVLRLHFAQEDEGYLSLLDEAPVTASL